MLEITSTSCTKEEWGRPVYEKLQWKEWSIQKKRSDLDCRHFRENLLSCGISIQCWRTDACGSTCYSTHQMCQKCISILCKSKVVHRLQVATVSTSGSLTRVFASAAISVPKLSALWSFQKSSHTLCHAATCPGHCSPNSCHLLISFPFHSWAFFLSFSLPILSFPHST